MAASADEVARESFAAVHALSKQWYDREREGIALIESFQTALLACRNEGGQPKQAPSSDGPMTAFLAKSDDAAKRMDPLLAEELYAQIGELRAVFSQLLGDMYVQLATAKAQANESSDGERDCRLSVLSVVEYVQFLEHEVASFEAEYQHVEALLAMISFSITVDQLRTLVISWSTSPFLDPEASREFRQRHERSQQLRSTPH